MPGHRTTYYIYIMKEKFQNLIKKIQRHGEPESLVITDENLAEHRAAMIKRGKKLKYPIQVSKKRILVTTCIIVVVAVLVSGALLYNALYRRQETGGFYYSVTRILPLPVAKVDGKVVRYQDYLRRARGDIYYLVSQEHRSFTSKEAIAQLNYIKRQDLTTTEKITYGAKLAEDNGITVTDKDVDDKTTAMREADDTTEEIFAKTLNEYYGWTVDDFHVMLKGQMLNEQVSYKMDTKAKEKINQAKDALDGGMDFVAVAKKYGTSGGGMESGATIDAKTTDRDPTGILRRMNKLKTGETTGVEKVSLDSSYYYYIGQVVSKDETKRKISYRVILVKLSYLDDQFNAIKSAGKIEEYIKI